MAGRVGRTCEGARPGEEAPEPRGRWSRRCAGVARCGSRHLRARRGRLEAGRVLARSSAGLPGTTSVGCIPPTTTCRRWSGNSGTVTTTRYRQPWPHSHGVRPAGGSPDRHVRAPGRISAGPPASAAAAARCRARPRNSQGSWWTAEASRVHHLPGREFPPRRGHPGRPPVVVTSSPARTAPGRPSGGSWCTCGPRPGRETGTPRDARGAARPGTGPGRARFPLPCRRGATGSGRGSPRRGSPLARCWAAPPHRRCAR
jgi:hypothetical protein